MLRYVLGDLMAAAQPPERFRSGIRNVDDVLGGGLVRGAATLLLGYMGAGKTALAIEIALTVAEAGNRVIYLSGDHCPGWFERTTTRRQLRLLTRLQVVRRNDGELPDALLDAFAYPDLVVLDSASGVFVAELGAKPKALHAETAVNILSARAQLEGFAALIVDRQASAKSEHLASVICELRPRTVSDRLFATIKNRYGPTPRSGILELTPRGFRSLK